MKMSEDEWREWYTQTIENYCREYLAELERNPPDPEKVRRDQLVADKIVKVCPAISERPKKSGWRMSPELVEGLRKRRKISNPIFEKYGLYDMIADESLSNL